MDQVLRMIWQFQEEVQDEIAKLKATVITDATYAAIQAMSVLEKQNCLLRLKILENQCKIQILGEGKPIPTKP